MNRKDFEIMAPVGSRESLAAALRAGADAVYFGIEGLNMRSRSSANFTQEDMAEIAALCNRCGVKTYLTVNTVIYDEDIAKMQSILRAAKTAGISAAIVSDLAAITYCKEIGMEAHISTQANITNIEAVKFYSAYAPVMVLARELNMEQVSRISQQIKKENICGPNGEQVRLEMFCHGALCMAVSGKCYMSLHQMNCSANRGQCNQICRRSYILTDRDTGEELAIENKYIMSPKDLKTIHFLNKVVDAGVRVLKIEGRARGPEYVAETVSCYDEALRAICDGTYSQEKIDAWDARLATVFNRGFWDGYYLGQRLPELTSSYGSSATHTKKYIAKARRFFPRLSVGEFKLEAGELKPGDEVILTGPKTGAVTFTVEQIRLETDPVEKAVKGDIFAIPVPAKVRKDDRLYLRLPKE